MGEKKFRDPIYGYIIVDDELIDKIVDTATFQRLRDVVQTSYAPLYSSALHNRFVHSIGVYHLGKITVQALLRSFGETSSPLVSTITEYMGIFELACLLHDVGHAPFSHTGEMLYLKNGERTELHHTLVELTGDETLEQEIVNNSYKAAPHEIMSAIIAMEAFPDMIHEEKRSFFARCICGYKYANDLDEQKSILNCMIELLNSKIIDVDKLDYLLRDAYMTGFDTVVIDYLRLLESVRFVENEKHHYEVCYTKSAVSVIENVVYAHDAERKWIQTHPTVLYESYIIENVLMDILEKIIHQDYLPKALLSEVGVNLQGFGKIRLMGDSDIRYLMKNLPDDSLCKKYYERRLRKHPIWKSEAEFQAIFQGSESELEFIKEEFDSLKDYLRSCGLPFLINDDAMNTCKFEIDELKKELEAAGESGREKTLQSLETRKEHLQWMQILEEFAKDQHISFEFLVIYTNQFNSGFRKQEFGDIKILFPELRQPCKFGEVSNVLKSEKSRGEKFFFLFYNRDEEQKEISIMQLVARMLTLAGRLHLEKKAKQRLL